MVGIVTAGLVIAATGLLIYAALHDLAVRTVPNWLCLLVLVFGLGLRLIDHSLLVGLIVTAVSFVLLFGLWILGTMGGGDVKLWTATVLLIPPGLVPDLMFFARVVLLGGALAVLYMGLSYVVPRPVSLPAGGNHLRRYLRAELWRIGRRGPLPYACAIAGGALTILLPHSFPG